MKVFGQLQPILWVALFFAYVSTVDSSGILCYKCTVVPKPGTKLTGGQTCSRFKKTPEFQVNCPNSTFCMKRSIHHRLNNGSLVLTSVERGCAPQLYVGQVYDYKKRAWYTEQKVVTKAYEEGCITGEDRGSPGGPPEYCYCSYHLCNGSFASKNVYILTVLLTSLLLWMQRCFH